MLLLSKSFCFICFCRQKVLMYCVLIITTNKKEKSSSPKSKRLSNKSVLNILIFRTFTNNNYILSSLTIFTFCGKLRHACITFVTAIMGIVRIYQSSCYKEEKLQQLKRENLFCMEPQNKHFEYTTETYLTYDEQRDILLLSYKCTNKK